MRSRISGEPDRLESYTSHTRALIGRERQSIAEYSAAVRAFFAAEPNDFGDGGVVDRTATLEGVVDGIERIDAKPAAFAFALHQLDGDGRGVLSTTDTRMFGALVQARLDMPFASDRDVRGEAHLRTAETLELEGGLSATDLARLILDLVGIFDPTPISDGASGLMSLFRGEWSHATLSLAATLPFAGDAGKILKFKKTLGAFQHLSKIAGDPTQFEKLRKCLKHIDWTNPTKVNEALGTMNRLVGAAAKRYKDPKVLEAAKKRGLPTEGPVPFVPPKRWDVNNPPTAPGPAGSRNRRGILDAYGNGWVWDPIKKEWDVQIPHQGKFRAFSPDGQHANISTGGEVTH